MSRSVLRSSLLRPEPLLALVVLLASLVYLLSSREVNGTGPATVEVSESTLPASVTSEVRIVRYDANGLETPTFVPVALPQSPGERLAAIIGALREETLGEEWPEALPAPTVFFETVGLRQVAILDFRPESELPLSVAGERRLLRSIEETLLANGVEQIRYLLDGEAAGVFLEHLAVPSNL